MNWTIDFKGGTEIIFAFKDKTTGKFVNVDPAKVRETFEKAKEHGVELSDITYTEETAAGEERVHGMIVRSPRFSALTPAQQQKTTTDFLAKFSDREVGKAGERLRNDAAKSLIYAIFLIMLYLVFRFDVRYAPGAAFATIHDAIMVIGVFAITWTEVSLTSVAGLLTVVGFSVNDTVVVFDRIRENQAKIKDKSIERIVDMSLNEVLVRTILTSSTVFATTLIMNIFGTGLVRNFAFAMNIGVVVGTYSSIFLAVPIFMWVSKKWYSGPPKTRKLPAYAVAAAKNKPEEKADDKSDDSDE
jgi:preprotein translocase SecF subunit